jgi:two-component system OmpR family sensor kinase
MGARPRVHLRMIAQVWGVDVALSTVGLLAALEAVDHPWAALLPLPLVLLLGSLARDRTDKVAAAHERLVALERERGRRQAAAQLLERQTHFLQDVSHELRTPITIARGHVEMLLRRSPRRNGDVGVALDELERIERIVERLLVLVRAGEPRTVARERLDAEGFLEDRFVRWSDTVPRPWQLGALAPGTLIGDGDALRAALDALIENAIKHTTPAQAIRVSSRLDRGELVVEVADEGPGVAPEALEHIFERFARADPGRSFGSDGLGLGLAIADAVARVHGGACTVSSSPAGATFALRLASFEPGRRA